MDNNILEYQKLDGQLRAIELELSNTEERKRMRTCLQFLKDSEENLKKMESDASDIYTKYNSLKEQYEKNIALIDEYFEEADKSTDEDEINYLSKKFADLSRLINGLERDISAVAAEADKISKQFTDYRNKLPMVKKQYADAKEGFANIRKVREPEIAEFQRKKAELEKKLNPEVLKIYEDIKAQNISRPFVALEGANRCGGCRMELPTGQISLLETKGFVRCDNCHRIIYAQHNK